MIISGPESRCRFRFVIGWIAWSRSRRDAELPGDPAGSWSLYRISTPFAREICRDNERMKPQVQAGRIAEGRANENGLRVVCANPPQALELRQKERRSKDRQRGE